AADWREFFGNSSPVEALLLDETSYERSDHRTRDRYRDAIEELARRSGRAEADVAAAALALCRAPRAADRPQQVPARQGDIGYWLIDGGRVALEQRFGVAPSLRQRLLRALLPHASGRYVLLVAGLTLTIVAAALAWIGALDGPPPSIAARVAFAVAALWPASELALALVNRLLMTVFPARRLPRLGLQQGLPEDCGTLLATPVLLHSVAQVRHLVEQLEVHAAANRDPMIRFALLSDWADAPTEQAPDDAALLAAARDGIEHLNAADRAAGRSAPRFYLLHRRRLWNARERCWMGWERKRGKLEELNALLLRGEAGSFLAGADGRLDYPRDVRYVITLDADTRLPLDAAAEMVGTAAHPLNRPVFDAARGRVVSGYGIVQPRIVPLLPRRGERSLYRDIVGGRSGMDPYAGAVSDVYQDVFREGIYTGKGLYDVAVFDRAMRGRIPENRVLSHDLLESVYARTALASDIECYEEFPSHAEVGAARLHRWTRGDWQLLPWLAGRRSRGIGLLNRWKLFDNLRRSLVAPASVLLVCAAWAGGIPGGIALALVLAPALLPDLLAVPPRFLAAWRERAARPWLRTELLRLGVDLRNALATLALLAQNAWLMCDAIGRALLRQFLTRRRLLEWVTAAQAKAQAHLGLSAFAWSMKGATIVVVFAAAVVMALRPAALREAAPLLLLWWLSPVIALGVSRSADAPYRVPGPRAPPVLALRRTARATWRYFEATVTAAENHLPPDNLQETPHPVTAHRTSPTNVSLYLLAVASARDLGWLGLRDALARIEATLATIERLEQHRGHLFNWYDTRRVEPLEPRYVSTVDSGNFCAHLLALAHWLRQQRAGPGIEVA
ncbi:MAG: hypothetical protein IT481_13830, partial [Gammaproteobacteria bacterium]|nr:hypothetical protein [Gammaproteobacteria bacterium]